MEKTKVMEFRFQRRKDPSPSYSLYNQIIEVTKSYRYLGIILTSNGGLKTAADTLAKQGQKSLFCLLKRLRNYNTLTRYCSAIYSMLLYDQSWNTVVRLGAT